MSRIAWASGRFMRGPLARGEGARLSTSMLPVTIVRATSVQDPLQILSSVRVFQLRDRFGRTEAHEVPTAISAFRTEVNDPVSSLDDFKIVLDDDNGPPRID